MDALRQDVLYALRSLSAARGFTVVVVLTLALGIGANSAIFSVVDAVLLRPLPFPEGRRVVHLAWEGGGHLQLLSSAKFQYWHDHARAFEAVATWRSSRADVDARGSVAAVRMLSVSGEFLEALGYTPILGRAFTRDERAGGRPATAIVSHTMWRTHLAGDADVVGRSMTVDGEPFTIVGVLPESFTFPYEDERVDVLVPLRQLADPTDIAEDWPTIARLRPHLTREQAHADVVSLNASFTSDYPAQRSAQDRGMTTATFSELYVNASVHRALWVLMGGVVLVLLIACANVANLFLARAARRRGEIALRAALGATRARMASVVLAEAVIVALAAAAFGLLTGRWVAGALVALTPVDIAGIDTVALDWRVMFFTTASALMTSLLSGSAAAWPPARGTVVEALSERARGHSRRSRMRQGLLVVQSALAMVLLVAAGLLVMTLMGLTNVDPGFDREGLVAVRLPARPAGYETPQSLWQLEQQIFERLEGIAAIGSIAAASSLPMERGINTRMSISGRPDVVGTVEWRAITPEYFRTLGIAVLTGRTFADTDVAGGQPVAIVNDAFARRYFPDRSPIGQRIDIGRSAAETGVEIVGVVADIREVSLRAEPRRTIYVPQPQASAALSSLSKLLPVLLVRTSLPDRELERAVTQALRVAEPAVSAPQVVPLGAVIARSLARERFGATLLSVLAALAVGLTALGIFGVLTYSVQQRRREIGIRLALGARTPQVTRLVMTQGVVPVLVGLLCGGAGAIGLSRAIASFLWGVTPGDPATIAAVAAILLSVALAASWLPARQAASLDPVAALNRE